MNTNFTLLAVAKHKKNTVNNFLFILMGMLLIFTLNASAQEGCNLSNTNGYYGGFEALPYLSTSGGTNGANNFGTTAASTDYTYGSGQTQYQILSSTAGQSGYLALNPHSNSYFLTSHTSSSQPNLKLWYKTLTVSPGQIFQISAWIANLKVNPVGGFPISILVNTYTVDPPTTLTTVVATNFAVTNAWVQITGFYTVPIGITSIQVEIKDPSPTYPLTAPTSHFLALDDICIALQPAGGPLPVSLVDFTATKQNKVVDLNWQTSIEQNSSYFDVEFSRDGSKFESIGKVKASISSTTYKSYSTKHLSPVNGLNYYRLKLVDVDGSSKYSAVRTVKFSN
ncbi:MAG: hypothetical protein H7254_12630, partial [Ferruginibacter sp.]|nr:hypothetical protein [Ferruginibacter sp.]